MSEFEGAGQNVGKELWRIEAMKPVRHEFNGKLYSGDSYILLVTTEKVKGGARIWNIHFWIGEESSKDESVVAAYKCVELDDFLGGAPTQHRECQNRESELFMSYFKETGLEYVKGGVDSALNKVDRDLWRVKRLMQCKGKRVVRCSERPCTKASLNNNDVFILDLGLEIIIWNGKNANKYEKMKGLEMALKLHNERGAKGLISSIGHAGPAGKEAVDPENATFWAALGGYTVVTEEGEDDEAAATAQGEAKLFRISDRGEGGVGGGGSGGVSVEAVPRDEHGNLTHSMLNTLDCYILDAGECVFVWTGKRSSKREKKEAMVMAQKFIADQDRPMNTPVERNVEFGESVLFKNHFHEFDPVLTPEEMKPVSTIGHVAKAPEQKEVDVAALVASKKLEQTPVDDGSGTLEIWRVEDFKKVPVDPATYGQFYGGDSYVLLYSYTLRGRPAWIIYFWQGATSSKDQVGASALLAAELDDAIGGAPVQVRVVQGKEPLHFRSLFKGTMVVHEGGRRSGFKNSSEDSCDQDGVALFHIKGTNPVDVVAVQTTERCSSLNSMDLFVLVTPSTTFVWNGKGANAAECESALKIANVLKEHSFGPGSPPPERAVQEVPEGQEPEEFWTFLGGKGEYAEQPASEPLPCEPRLFQCTDRFGALMVEEIPNFDQGDLLDDDVMMLDVGTCVYLWVGHEANAREKAESMGVAARFMAAESTDGRDPHGPILQVAAGHEPLMFTQFFPTWDPHLAEKRKFHDPLEARREELEGIKAKREAERQAEEAASNPVLERRRSSIGELEERRLRGACEGIAAGSSWFEARGELAESKVLARRRSSLDAIQALELRREAQKSVKDNFQPAYSLPSARPSVPATHEPPPPSEHVFAEGPQIGDVVEFKVFGAAERSGKVVKRIGLRLRVEAEDGKLSWTEVKMVTDFYSTAVAAEKAAAKAEQEAKAAEAEKAARAAKQAARDAEKVKAAAAKGEESAAAAVPQESSSSLASLTNSYVAPGSSTFTYEELSTGIPSGVNPAQKEEYLADAVFEEKFGMNKESFAKLPGWKRTKKKKELKLF